MKAHDIERVRCFSPSQGLWVDLRIVDFGGSSVASCDTPDGPSLAWDVSRLGAILAALEPFHDVVPGLLENQRPLQVVLCTSRP